MTGGTVINVRVATPRRVCVDCRQPDGTMTSAIVHPNGHRIRAGDQMFWEKTKAYWTPAGKPGGLQNVTLERWT